MNAFDTEVSTSHRVTQRRKDSNHHAWYKKQIDHLGNHSFSANTFSNLTGISQYHKKRVNYDLFNNKINIKDFEYVCRPFGAETGELPANFSNRDIVSSKIKVLLGMEMSMPFDWKVIAVNPEATTRKEEEQFSRMREYVISQVMSPIRAKIEQQHQEQVKGQQLTPEQQQEVQQQIEKETQAATPDQVRKYMVREHQDPAEVLANQILRYLQLEEMMKFKFNKGWKHVHLGGEEIYHIGIFNGEPGARTINPLHFDCDRSQEIDFIEDGEWASCEYNMSPSQIIATFGSELTNHEIDRIYKYDIRGQAASTADFSFDDNNYGTENTIRIFHGNFKSLRKIGFLTYQDQDQQTQLKLVDENYELDEDAGDIDITWEWIPESHEGYKILDDIYVYCRPVPGQLFDIDNLYKCKLSYFGASYDNLNSEVTSTMDRIKSYQYFYNVIIYRMELLMASDKGKMLMMNINAIPTSSGIDLNKFMYFLEANHIGFFNPNEEGNKGNNSADIVNMVKEIDMSLISNIKNYMELAEFIDQKCGNSIGVTKAMEAQIGASEAVSNTRQNITQASHILRPHFELHNIVKGNVLTGLLEAAKVAYTEGKPKMLNFVLDDMSVQMLAVDQELLDNSQYGLFVSNSAKADEAKQAVIQLSQAAMQNDQANLVDVIRIIRSESITEAEELVEVSQAKRQEQAQAAEEAKAKAEKEAAAMLDKRTRDLWQHEKDIVILKAEEDRKTEIQKQTILSLGFAKNTDQDDDGIPDVLEVAKFGVDADIKAKKLLQDDQHLQLEQDKFSHQQKTDAEQLKLDKEKNQIAKIKKKAP